MTQAARGDADAAPGEGFHTQAQRTAIETIDRPVLVLAGAGTGKTFLLATKIAWIEGTYGHGSTAAITFSRRAANELRERVDAMHAAAGTKRDPRTLIGTFHNVASGLIRRAHRATILDRRPRLADDRDQAQYAALALAGADEEPGRTQGGAERRKGADAANRAVIVQIEKVKRAGLVPVAGGYEDTDGTVHANVAGLPLAGSRQHAISLRYCELMQERGQCDYADLILIATRLLKSHGDTLLAGLVAVTVDEFQDTDKAQNDMVKAMSRGRHLTCVGDDDQSVYAWRGARVENILEFANDHADALTVTLDVNYRCPPDLLRHAMALVSRNAAGTTRRAKAVTAAAGEPETPSVVMHDIHAAYPTTRRSSIDQLKRTDIPHYVGALIDRLVSEGARPSEITCLARSNHEVEALESALEQVGIETRIANPNAISTREARRLTAWMRLIVDPDEIAAAATVTDSLPGDRAFQDVVTGARQDGVAVMDRLAAAATAGRCGTRRFEEAGLRYAALDAMRTAASPIDMIEAVCRAEADALENHHGLSGRRRAEHFWSIYNGLVVLLADAETIDDAIEFMQTRISEDDLVVTEREVVEISTIHSVKGRQKPIVVLSAFIDGLFPRMETLGKPADLAEERRLAYVAMTRAQRTLHLVVAGDRPTTFGTEAGLMHIKRTGP